MRNELVSVIIPIYNCEQYLEKTLNSIINQTYKNLEIMLVNDGSKDKSGDICDDFSTRDKRIKVYHKENTGVSDTRNFALKNATGKYIYFMDSDDYVEPDMLSKFIDIYKKYDVQLVNAGFFSEIHSYKKDKLVKSIDEITIEECYLKTKEEIKENLVMLWDTHMLYNIWNKLYLNDIIQKNKIIFPEYNWGEDIEFNRRYLFYVNSIYHTKNCYYHYIRERQGAVTAKYKADLYDIRIRENKEFKEYFEQNGISKNEYIEFTSRRHIERTLGCIEQLFNDKCNLSLKEKYKETKKIINDSITKECLKEMKPTSKKIKILLISYKIKSSILAMVIGKSLSLVKKMFPNVFNKMKNNR